MYTQVGEILDRRFVMGLYIRRIHSQVGKVRHLLQSEVMILALNCEVNDVGAGG